MEVKPGFKTTEFLQTIQGSILTLVPAALTENVDIRRTCIYCFTAITVSYIFSRALTKKNSSDSA